MSVPAWQSHGSRVDPELTTSIMTVRAGHSGSSPSRQRPSCGQLAAAEPAGANAKPHVPFLVMLLLISAMSADVSPTSIAMRSSTPAEAPGCATWPPARKGTGARAVLHALTATVSSRVTGSCLQLR